MPVMPTENPSPPLIGLSQPRNACWRHSRRRCRSFWRSSARRCWPISRANNRSPQEFRHGTTAHRLPLEPTVRMPVKTTRHRAAAHSRAASEATSSAATTSPLVPAPTGREAITRKLLDIVRERTGYPQEVLRLELDLEAELGIDSIKRVEILGKLRDAFPQIGNASDPKAMDRLVSAKTLAAIVDRVERAIRNAGGSSKSPSASTTTEPKQVGEMQKRQGPPRHASAAAGDGGLPSRRHGKRIDGGRNRTHHRRRSRNRRGPGRCDQVQRLEGSVDRRPGLAIGLDISRRGGERDPRGVTRWAARGTCPSLAAPIGPASRA